MTTKSGRKKSSKKKNWIKGAVKHPGALTKAASAHGVSKKAEAERESHSSDPKIRGRGLLGLRFMGKHGGVRGRKKTSRKKTSRR